MGVPIIWGDEAAACGLLLMRVVWPVRHNFPADVDSHEERCIGELATQGAGKGDRCGSALMPEICAMKLTAIQPNSR